MKMVSNILKKPENERTAADADIVEKHPDIVKKSETNAKRSQANKDRLLETEDEPDELASKCEQLADLIRNATKIVVYTGAGISTAASIPDYRGPNGVWTLLKKGHELSPQDLSDAEPTFTHMSITKLFRKGKVKHVVSQNCDGLHIRSGFPRYALSEVHGNMYVEICYNCSPQTEYVRLFDVTEKTGVRRHMTGRKCRTCKFNLVDTIVHFGEKGKIKSPYRWKEAVRAAKSTELILCLGTSLKILKRYSCLWCMDRSIQQRPPLVIVNLQWTPKDAQAELKINGRCDDVMRTVMNLLEYSVPEYDRDIDPIFKLYTPLKAIELKTTRKKILMPPVHMNKSRVRTLKPVVKPPEKPPPKLKRGMPKVSLPAENQQVNGNDIKSMENGVSCNTFEKSDNKDFNQYASGVKTEKLCDIDESQGSKVPNEKSSFSPEKTRECRGLIEDLKSEVKKEGYDSETESANPSTVVINLDEINSQNRTNYNAIDKLTDSDEDFTKTVSLDTKVDLSLPNGLLDFVLGHQSSDAPTILDEDTSLKQRNKESRSQKPQRLKNLCTKPSTSYSPYKCPTSTVNSFNRTQDRPTLHRGSSCETTSSAASINRSSQNHLLLSNLLHVPEILSTSTIPKLTQSSSLSSNVHYHKMPTYSSHNEYNTLSNILSDLIVKTPVTHDNSELPVSMGHNKLSQLSTPESKYEPILPDPVSNSLSGLPAFGLTFFKEKTVSLDHCYTQREAKVKGGSAVTCASPLQAVRRESVDSEGGLPEVMEASSASHINSNLTRLEVNTGHVGSKVPPSQTVSPRVNPISQTANFPLSTDILGAMNNDETNCSSQFSGIRTINSEDRLKSPISVPACVLNMDEMESPRVSKDQLILKESRSPPKKPGTSADLNVGIPCSVSCSNANVLVSSRLQSAPRPLSPRSENKRGLPEKSYSRSEPTDYTHYLTDHSEHTSSLCTVTNSEASPKLLISANQSNKILNNEEPTKKKDSNVKSVKCTGSHTSAPMVSQANQGKASSQITAAERRKREKDSSPALPGWFGKGLNIKKKRKC